MYQNCLKFNIYFIKKNTKMTSTVSKWTLFEKTFLKISALHKDFTKIKKRIWLVQKSVDFYKN